MMLKPRYSLLTLLILTALVAGGVKLWYGPHHVVEPDEKNWEAEFTYTRDWRGDRIVEGPVVFRHYKNSKIDIFDVRYYRQGIDSQWMHCCCVTEQSAFYLAHFFVDAEKECPLSKPELLAFDRSSAAELQRLDNVGIRRKAQFKGANLYSRNISSLP